MLYQSTTTTNSGKLVIENMTNDGLSLTAIDAIGNELLDEEIEKVGVSCSFSSDEKDKNGVYQNEFDVYDSEGSYLFSVTNSGVTYSI